MAKRQGVFHKKLKCECNRRGCRTCRSRNYMRRMAAEHQANPLNSVVFRRSPRSRRVAFDGQVTTRPLVVRNGQTEGTSRERREAFFERRRQAWRERLAEILG
jgi:hypothetical protein